MDRSLTPLLRWVSGQLQDVCFGSSCQKNSLLKIVEFRLKVALLCFPAPPTLSFKITKLLGQLGVSVV